MLIQNLFARRFPVFDAATFLPYTFFSTGAFTRAGIIIYFVTC